MIMYNTNKYMNSAVIQVLKGKTEVKAKDLIAFWDTIFESSENTLYYAFELIKTLIAFETGRKITKNLNFSTVLSSFIVTAYFYQISIDKAVNVSFWKSNLSEVEKDWRSFSEKKEEKQSYKNPYLISIINAFFQSLQGDEKQKLDVAMACLFRIPPEIKNNVNILQKEIVIEEARKNTINEHIKEFFSKMEFYQKAIKPSDQPLFTQLINEHFEPNNTGELSYLYEYFQRFLCNCKKNFDITLYEDLWSNLIYFLKIVPYVVNKNPQYGEQAGLAIMHVLKQMIVFYPLITNDKFNENEMLKSLITQIEKYRRYPFPIGFLASELLKTLIAESKSIGNSYRFKIRQEIPGIDFLYYDKTQTDNLPLQIVYFFCGEPLSSLVSGILHQNILRTENATSINCHMLRVAILGHILTVHRKSNVELIKHLAGVNERDIFLVYCRILNVLEKCDELESLVDIRAITDKALDELVRQILYMRSENTDTKYNIISTLVDEYKHSLLPPFPPNNFKQVNTKGSKEEIFLMAQKIKEGNLPYHQEPLKFLLYGDDDEIHNFVQEIGALISVSPKIFDNIDFRIYIVPHRNNTLAKFLASKDFWYSESIYLPFVEELLLPKLEVEPITNKDPMGNLANIEKSVYPFQLMENLIQTYIHEAMRVINLKIYEIQVFKKKNLDVENLPPPDDKIYLFSSLEIGASVYAENLKQTNKKVPMESTVYEIKDKGHLKFTSIELEIESESCDMLGNEEDPELIKANVHNLKINNIYKEYFEGNVPFPNSDWLELSYIDFDNSKHEYSCLKKKLLLRKFSKEQLGNAFFSLHPALPVLNCKITGFKQPFEILVDGKIYGPYEQIFIKPLQKTDENFSLPIMTFLPINL